MVTNARHTVRPYLILVGLLYTVVGFGTGEMARMASSVRAGNIWRLAGWVLSFLVFAGHLVYERRWRSKPTATAAWHIAVAVGVGAFVLAIVGPVRSHWGAADFGRATLLSLLLWPIVTGVPAFLVALIVGSVLGRVPRDSRGSSP
jgi:hypothetical protein